MSGLIFKGDVVQSTGEYLPAPYINKITALQDRDEDDNKYCRYNIQIYIFADDYSYVDVEQGGDIKGSQEAYKDYLNGFNYYIMVASGFSQEEYDRLTMGEMNPLLFYKKFEDKEYDAGEARMYRFEALSTDSPQDFYDQAGNKVVVYPTTIQSTEINSEPASNTFTVNSSLLTNDDGRFDQNVEYVFCFCSLFNYDDDSQLLAEESFNSQLLDLQTGDVSYERFYTSGDGNELEVQESAKFYDVDNVLYDKTPLASVDQDVYKILNLTHDDIKDSINSLLSEYSAQYNAENGFTQLKNVMNAIYSTLAQYGDDYNIVPKLEIIRATFPNKNPTTPVGKLYKRYSKRLFEINKSIKEAELLYKKLVYNTKISDQRFSPLPTDMLNSLQDGQNYLYSEIENFTNLGVDEQNGSIVAGYFFFDYEKALRLQCMLSNYLNINKLEALGFNLPYETFMVKEVESSRRFSSTTTIIEPTTRIMTSKVNDASVGTQKYPVVENIDYNGLARFTLFYITPKDISSYGDDVSTSIFYGTGVSDSASENASLGYITSVVNRSYAYTPSDEFEITDYRLMLYELLEYRKTYNSDGYNVELTIHDDTLKEYLNIFNIFSDYYNELVNYASLASETCVYNHNLEKFNEYFIQNLLDQYEENSEAIWYTAPVIYAMYLDLLYDSYGGDLDEIESAAKAIVNAINPNIGNLESIENFLDSMTELYEVLDGIKTLINDENETQIQIRTFSSSTLPVVYEVPVPVDLVFTANIDIPDPQDKVYSGEAVGEDEIAILDSKTGVAIHGSFAITNDGGADRSDLYASLFPSNLTTPITEILSVSFRELKDGVYQEETQIPPNYTTTNSDGTQQGSYTDSNGDLIYAYHAGNYSFIAYKLGIYTVYYN